MTGSEDFARFLDLVPGCIVFLGNGAEPPPLHNPNYDFNDEGLLDLPISIKRSFGGDCRKRSPGGISNSISTRALMDLP